LQLKIIMKPEQQTVSEWLNDYKGETKLDMTRYAGAESKFLKAADLNGQKIKVQIAGVELVEFDDDDGNKFEKPCLKLQGKEKMIVCNATSVQELGNAYGYDSENWVGREIGLSTKYYQAFGKEGLVITALGVKEQFVDLDDPF